MQVLEAGLPKSRSNSMFVCSARIVSSRVADYHAEATTSGQVHKVAQSIRANNYEVSTHLSEAHKMLEAESLTCTIQLHT